MSTISGLGGANRSWDTGQQQTRKAEHEAKMFAKVDTDGNGSVDATELAAMLKKGDASSDVDSAALLKQMDTDGNGSLSSDELSKGMHDLMPRPASTMDFAQARGAASDDGSSSDADAFAKLDTDGDGKLSRTEFEAGRKAGGPHGAGGPPPAQGSGSSTSTSATSSTSFDPLDANQDGTVSQIERLAGQLKELAQSGSSGSDATAKGSSSEIAALAQKLYDQISKNWLQPGAQTSVSQVNLSA